MSRSHALAESGLYARLVDDLREAVLTNAELAEITGVKTRQVQHWASGAHRPQGEAKDRLLRASLHRGAASGDLHSRRHGHLGSWSQPQPRKSETDRPTPRRRLRAGARGRRALGVGSDVDGGSGHRRRRCGRRRHHDRGQVPASYLPALSHALRQCFRRPLGPGGAYPVLYLARPTDAVVVEAHRHLVESVEGMRPQLVGPRRLLTCEVRITQVLDLRDASIREIVEIRLDDLTTEVGDYAACHRIAQAAHQLGLHGVIAPGAGGIGETLAVFERRLPGAEQPVLVAEDMWDQLPPDPRRSRLEQPDPRDGLLD